MKLDLQKLWEICNKLSWETEKLFEKDIYIHLLGCRSNYNSTNFENFLSYYSFKIENDTITVFNQDGVPYEDYSNDDFSYIQISLLYFSPKQLEKWIDDEIKVQLKQQENSKILEKENIKLQIIRLQKQLDS